MKGSKYTIPLMVLIAYYLKSDTCVKYRIENENALFVTEMDSRLGVQGTEIIATFNGLKFFFKPSQKVQVHGQFLQQYWNHWKSNGKEEFYKWFNSIN